jgi:hypothetical protein
MSQDRKSLKLLDELSKFIVVCPWIIVILFGLDFALNRYAGVQLSHLQRILIAVVMSSLVLAFLPKPRRGAILIGGLGWLVVGLALALELASKS